jgi:predicted aldo/keto reductase-like oxidoreductase
LSFLSQKLNPEARDKHDLAEAAVRFILSLQGVTTVLGGFSDKQQVEEIAACSGKGPLSVQNMTRLEMVWRDNFGLSR